MNDNTTRDLPFYKNLIRSFDEDKEALVSPSYIQAIATSRKSKKRYSSEHVKKELGI